MYVCMYVCVYIYIYIYIRVCVYIYIYTYLYRHKQTNIHTYTHCIHIIKHTSSSLRQSRVHAAHRLAGAVFPCSGCAAKCNRTQWILHARQKCPLCGFLLHFYFYHVDRILKLRASSVALAEQQQKSIRTTRTLLMHRKGRLVRKKTKKHTKERTFLSSLARESMADLHAFPTRTTKNPQGEDS